VRVIGALVSLIYKSLFLKGASGVKDAHSIAKVAYIVAFVAAAYLRDDSVYFAAVTAAAMALADSGLDWVVPAVTLSSIPASWYALTAYIISLAGVPPEVTLGDAAVIFARTLSISLVIMFVIYSMDPISISNALHAVGARKAASAPLLIWRVMPYGLSTMVESLAIGELKGEGAGKRIAPAIAAIIEHGRGVEASAYLRLAAPMIYKLPKRISKFFTALFLMSATALFLCAMP